jgi:nitrous oxidase accessory protein
MSSSLLAGDSSPANPLQTQIDSTPAGATLAVPAGTYLGPLVIHKPVSLTGTDDPVIDGAGQGSVVTILADGVTLCGFRITGSGANLSKDEAGVFVQASRVTLQANRIDNALHGIYLKQCKDLSIRRNRIVGMTALPRPLATPGSAAATLDLCSVQTRDINTRGNGIHLWNSSGVIIEENEITESRDGIYFSFSHDCVVRNNVVSRVRYGLHYMYSDDNRFENNRFTNNVAGAAMMYSKGLTIRANVFEANHGFRAYGLLLNAMDQTRIEENRILSNNVGIFLENSNGNLFLGNTVASNYIGFRLTASSDSNRFSRNRLLDNLHPAELAGGLSGTNRWSSGGVGNYWQEASPVDLNGDGIGDLPYLQSDPLGKVRESFPLVSLLSGSPALEILQFAQQRMELPGLSAIKDPAPLTSSTFKAPP